MFCRKCGNQLMDQAKFCNRCGTPVQMQAPQGYVPEQYTLQNYAPKEYTAGLGYAPVDYAAGSGYAPEGYDPGPGYVPEEYDLQPRSGKAKKKRSGEPKWLFPVLLVIILLLLGGIVYEVIDLIRINGAASEVEIPKISIRDEADADEEAENSDAEESESVVSASSQE